jgi:type I restriction enzyme S subunit
MSEVKAGFTYFQTGDVLVAKITPCFENGKIAQVCSALGHGYGSTEFHVVRARPDRANPRFILHYLRQDRIRIEGERKMTGSAGQRRVPKHFLEELPIPLPPIEEQRRIAGILDKAEALRAKRRQAIARLDTLAQSIFIEMFGDPVTNPKGWATALVGDISDVQGGLQLGPSRSKPASNKCELPYLRVANVYRDQLDLAEIKTMWATRPESRRTCLRAGDVLFVEGHGNPEEIGRCAVWDGSIEPCLHQNHLIRVRCDAEYMNPYFLSRQVNSPSGRVKLRKSGKTTSGLNTISVSNIRSVSVIRPPIHLQNEFQQKLDAVGQRRAALESSSVHLDSLFASLQHRAFRGEL